MPACHAGGHEFESRTHRKDTPSDEARAPSDFFIAYNLKPLFNLVFHPLVFAFFRSKLLKFPHFSCSFGQSPRLFSRSTPTFFTLFFPTYDLKFSHFICFTFVKGHKWRGQSYAMAWSFVVFCTDEDAHVGIEMLHLSFFIFNLGRSPQRCTV